MYRKCGWYSYSLANSIYEIQDVILNLDLTPPETMLTSNFDINHWPCIFIIKVTRQLQFIEFGTGCSPWGQKPKNITIIMNMHRNELQTMPNTPGTRNINIRMALSLG